MDNQQDIKSKLIHDMLFGIFGVGGRADKIVSRENIAMLAGLYGMAEAHASSTEIGVYALISMIVLRGFKAYETVKSNGTVNQTKLIVSKTNKVSTKEATVVDTQDKPSSAPSFE